LADLCDQFVKPLKRLESPLLKFLLSKVDDLTFRVSALQPN